MSLGPRIGLWCSCLRHHKETWPTIIAYSSITRWFWPFMTRTNSGPTDWSLRTTLKSHYCTLHLNYDHLRGQLKITNAHYIKTNNFMPFIQSANRLPTVVLIASQKSLSSLLVFLCSGCCLLWFYMIKNGSLLLEIIMRENDHLS